jgi:chaperonin GroEL
MGRLVSLTLGPVKGTIANERDGTGEIELIHDAATAVRRVIQLPDRVADPGAMLMRHLVWSVRQEVGDGSATSAVIAGSLARETERVIAAGANAMVLRRGIEKGLAAALQALDAMSIPLEGEERIAAVATAAAGDAEIGRLLGEIYDVLGPHASIVVVPYVAPFHDRAYREGARFEGSYASPFLLADDASRSAQLDDVHVLVADVPIDTAEQAAYLLEQVAGLGGTALFVVCKKISDKAVGVLAANNERGAVQSMVATLKPLGDARHGAIENIAILTGGQPLNDRAGLVVDMITPADYGHADRVVVDKDQFVIIGGGGSPEAVEERTRALRERLRRAQDPEERDVCRQLLTQFSRGVAELRVGAFTPRARTEACELARQAIQAVSSGTESGVVPGGGAAYLACAPAVRAVPAHGDEALGLEILARALEEPLR